MRMDAIWCSSIESEFASRILRKPDVDSMISSTGLPTEVNGIIIEYIQIQSCCRCGLPSVNLIEIWTGEDLEIKEKQEDKHFESQFSGVHPECYTLSYLESFRNRKKHDEWRVFYISWLSKIIHSFETILGRKELGIFIKQCARKRVTIPHLSDLTASADARFWEEVNTTVTASLVYTVYMNLSSLPPDCQIFVAVCSHYIWNSEVRKKLFAAGERTRFDLLTKWQTLIQ